MSVYRTIGPLVLNRNEVPYIWVKYVVTVARQLCGIIFMPPTSKKLRGHIGLGLSVQSVSQSVSLSVCL